MRPEHPTFWLLDGATGWRSGATDGVAVAAEAGIRLAADAAGPLALDSADGSFGGLQLPLGMAFDAKLRLHMLDHNTMCVKRYNAEKQAFEILPTVGGTGKNARRFMGATNIVIAGDDLYVADRGNARIQVFALSTLALRHVWGPLGKPDGVMADSETCWDPIDITAIDDLVFILDRRYGRVMSNRNGEDDLRMVFAVEDAADRWNRIMVDAQHCIYLLDETGDTPKLDVYDETGQKVEEVFDSGELLDRFTAPLIRLDHLQRFCLPGNLAQACAYADPAAIPTVAAPLANCQAGAGECGLLFDVRGNNLEPIIDPEPAGPYLYQREGIWTSEALDSEIYACQWHQVDIEFSDLPAGTQVIVSTFTDNEKRSQEEVNAVPEHLWKTQYRILGKMQPTGQAGLPVPHQTDTLVLSDEGQYIWLRLQFIADGFVSPAVNVIRSHYPRDSYLQYLPAVYSSDEESRSFMERFLSLFQAQWDEMEQTIDDIAMYFDPDAVPAGAFMQYLAEWLALPLEGAWDEEQKRHLLSAAPEIYPERGTATGLQRYLQVYLANLTGLEQEGLGDFPILIEGFRHRDYMTLTLKDHAVLGERHALWSAAVVGRLQLDVYAREGDVRLITTGDPDRDVFHNHAHRFHVLLPSAWIKTRADEDMLRRALDSEKPAHTFYDLCLVEPRFRVGVQSTLGMDTIIGDYPVAMLACPEENEDEVPITRSPRNRLGYDTVLAGGPGLNGGLPLNPDTRIGVNTLLS